MIKEIEITNFKAIGKTVRIPIRPITLLFGQNSAGKSSVLQCLLLLAQSLGTNDMKLQPRGMFVNLGTFKDFIYMNDLGNKFQVKFICEMDADYLYSSLNDYDDNGKERHSINNINNYGKKFIGILEKYKTFAIKIDFSSNDEHIYSVFLGNESYPVLIYNNALEVEYNFDHNFWKDYFICFKEDLQESIQKKALFWVSVSFQKSGDKLNDKDKLIFMTGYFSSAKIINILKQIFLESEDQSYLIKLATSNEPYMQILSLYYYLLDQSVYFLNGSILPETMGALTSREILASSSEMHTDVELFNPGVLALLLGEPIRDFLGTFHHVKPLRDLPERYYMAGMDDYERALVLYKNSELLEQVNKELSAIQSNYLLEIIGLTEPGGEDTPVLVFQFVDKELGLKATVKDVGFGFSQVLPIVLSSTSLSFTTLVIEQPELHLHPAMQAEMGDLFLRNSKIRDKRKARWFDDSNNTFLLETHSEHLILRLLRRIRETSENKVVEAIPPVMPDDIAILYINPGDEGAIVTHIPITEDGEFAVKWPQGFFPERSKELF